MKPKRFLCLMAITLSVGCSNRPYELFVSPGGSDAGSGTQKYPFQSFERAREEIAGLLESGMSGREIIVFFRGGSYFFEEGVVIKGTHVSTGNNHVVFSAYEDEVPVFSAGKILSGWELLKEMPEYLPEKAKGKVWVTKIPVTGQHVIARFLCDESGPLKNAVSEPLFTGEEEDAGTLTGNYPPSKEELSSFVIPANFFREWENLQDIEVITRPFYGWIMNILPLGSVDLTKGIATTSIPATYRIRRLQSYVKELPNLWIQNAIDYLDEPGEWVINSEEGKIYYWPEGGEPGNILYPLVQEIIRVEGNAGSGEILKNIEFRGITFSHGDRDSWHMTDIGLQHDWAMFNKPDALLRFVDTENCVVDNCRFDNSGGGGLRFDLFSHNNRVVNCEFSRLGGTALLFQGYGPGKKDVNRNNSVLNNEIHDCGQIYWHSPGIFIWQSGGNRIANNLIYNTPYTGIVISGPRPQFFNTRMKGLRELTGTFNYDEIGNFDVEGEDWYRFEPYVEKWDSMFRYLFAGDNVIENNELHHVDLRIDDGNAIYLSGTGYHNIVRNNFIYDAKSACLHGIIRADDQARDVAITENIIYRYSGEGIKIKHPCVVTNNYLIDWIPSGWPNGKISPKKEFLNVSPAGPIKGSVIQNNICYQSGGDTQPFFTVSLYYPLGKLTKLSDIDLDRNLYFAAGDPDDWVGKLKDLKAQGVDNNSIIADPLFEGFQVTGFKLKDNSPAFKLGIRQIGFENIGLLREPVK